MVPGPSFLVAKTTPSRVYHSFTTIPNENPTDAAINHTRSIVSIYVIRSNIASHSTFKRTLHTDFTIFTQTSQRNCYNFAIDRIILSTRCRCVRAKTGREFGSSHYPNGGGYPMRHFCCDRNRSCTRT
eukprot:comp22408_c0_seq1/m.33505 comp22408_c0_seq1/g.33505  ORF comp22408_c0_seq1/g.33505 comp22408_c0_seq1/m.33505 type:complete len:128 (-) comp22408_c0_seq1:3621-4004(-)